MNQGLEIYIHDSRIDYRNMYSLNLLVFADAKITHFQRFSELLNALDSHIPNGIMVYVDNDVKKNDPDKQISKILLEKNASPLTALIGLDKSQHPEVKCYPKDTTLKTLVKDFASSVGITAQKMASMQTEEYFPLPKSFFLPGWQAVHSLYTKKEDKFEEVIKAGDIINKEIMLEDEISMLYVHSKLRLDLVNSFTSRLKFFLLESNQTKEERVANTFKGFEMVAQSMQSIGLTESTIEVANASIQSLQEMTKNSNNLQDLINLLNDDKYSLRFKHSAVACYVGTQVLRKMEEKGSNAFIMWSSMCFFHDMLLEEDSWIWINTEEQLKTSLIPKEKHPLILNHAALTAKILSQYKDLPMGIETLIKQHHGSKMGNTMDKITLGISPLAILFIVVEAWAEMYFEVDANNGIHKQTYGEFIQSLKKKFPWPNFHKNIALFEDLRF